MGWQHPRAGRRTPVFWGSRAEPLGVLKAALLGLQLFASCYTSGQTPWEQAERIKGKKLRVCVCVCVSSLPSSKQRAAELLEPAAKPGCRHGGGTWRGGCGGGPIAADVLLGRERREVGMSRLKPEGKVCLLEMDLPQASLHGFASRKESPSPAVPVPPPLPPHEGKEGQK